MVISALLDVHTTTHPQFSSGEMCFFLDISQGFGKQSLFFLVLFIFRWLEEIKVLLLQRQSPWGCHIQVTFFNHLSMPPVPRFSRLQQWNRAGVSHLVLS